MAVLTINLNLEKPLLSQEGFYIIDPIGRLTFKRGEPLFIKITENVEASDNNQYKVLLTNWRNTTWGGGIPTGTGEGEGNYDKIVTVGNKASFGTLSETGTGNFTIVVMTLDYSKVWREDPQMKITNNGN